MKKYTKLLLAIGLFLILVFLFQNSGLAAGWLNVSDPVRLATGNSPRFSTIGGAISFIINLLLIIGAVVFFILFAVGGIMYLVGAGNDEQTGKAKKLLLDAVIGLAILYSSWAIANFTVYIFSGKPMNIQDFLLPEIYEESGGTNNNTGGGNNNTGGNDNDTGGDANLPVISDKVPEDCYLLGQGWDDSTKSCTNIPDQGYYDWKNEKDCVSPDVWNPSTKTCVQGFGT